MKTTLDIKKLADNITTELTEAQVIDLIMFLRIYVGE